MEHLALGRAAKIRGEKRSHEELENPGGVQAPAVSVLAPADFEQLPTAVPAADPLTVSRTIVVAIYVFLWFVLHVGYFIFHEELVYEIDLPWSVSAAELVVGSAIALHLWALKLRAAPHMTMADAKVIAPIALCHTLSHMCATIGLRDDAQFYYVAQIFIATQPLFAALFSAIFLEQTFSQWVYLTLVPVVAGVGLTFMEPAVLGQWVTFAGAMGFNLAASMRAILSKRAMGMDMGKNMSPANLHAVVTIMASAMFLPLSIIMEGFGIKDLWVATVGSLDKFGGGVIYLIVSAVCFHLYNEMAFRCLGLVHPLTLAVGSIFEQIFVILIFSIVIVFGWI